jgi:hypothetical protein
MLVPDDATEPTAARITAFPTLIPVTTPAVVMLATFSSLEYQITSWFESVAPLMFVTVAVSASVEPDASVVEPEAEMERAAGVMSGGAV